MATLKEKSETNIESALVLTQKQETCLSSVHCAYYSCFQLILYYLDTAYAYTDPKGKRNTTIISRHLLVEDDLVPMNIGSRNSLARLQPTSMLLTRWS